MVRATLISSLLLLAAFFTDCSTSYQAATPSVNPCNDSLYIAFKARDFKTLDQREYAYMMEKERQCWQYQQAVDMNANTKSVVDEASGRAGIWWFAGFVVAAGFVLYMLAVNGSR